MKQFTAWAIKTNDPEHSKDALIGRYWWFNNEPPNIPEHLRGCQFSLFATRKIAREKLKWVRQAYPKAQVVKVRAAIKTC